MGSATGTTGTATSISVPSGQPWTDTGISLTAGQQVSITASGTIYIGALGIPSYDYEPPNGDPWGGYDCNDNGAFPFTAPGLPCYSLIGRIGNGPAFEVGSSLTFTASSSGELFLGVNDSYYADNSGSFTAAIAVGTAPVGTGTPTPTSISVPSGQPWTDTGISLTAGEQVKITASGTIYIGALGISSYDYEGPAGQPWGSYDCNNNGALPYTATGLPCWSLIGRIGNGPAFEVGSSLTFAASSSGELFLGVNDSFYQDNSGFFNATVSVAPPGSVFVTPSVVQTVSISANPSPAYEGDIPPSIAVMVFDQNGFAMPGVTVNFTSSAGTLSSASAQTDTNGQASVTLSLGYVSQAPVKATVSATAGNVTNSTSEQFLPAATVPENWMQSSAFSVLQVALPLSQYLAVPVDAYDACIDFLLCQGTAVDAGALPTANLYLITPSNLQSPNEPEFESGLSQFFGISQCTASGQQNCIQSTYQPVAVVIAELPAAQAADVLFNGNLPTPISLCWPNQIPNPLGIRCIQSTAAGYVNLAFVVSRSTTSQQLIGDLLQAVAADLSTALKVQGNSGEIAAHVVGAFESNIKVLLDIGDLSVVVITSDLGQSGSLNSYTFLDLSGLPSALNNALSNGLTVSGYTGKILTILEDGGKFIGASGEAVATAETIVGAVPGLAGTIISGAQMTVTGLDLGVELLPTIDTSLTSNQLYQRFENGLGVVTSFLDPSGATIMPSFYDANGNLVLGYNAGNGTMRYASAEGILFPDGNGYLALLAENPSSPSNYSETLQAVGTATAPMPYTVRIRSFAPGQSIQAYTGMLESGSSVTIPIQISGTGGALLPQTFLDPAVTTQQTASTITVTANARLNDGSVTGATDAFLILNGQQSAMNAQSASTFQSTLSSTNFPGATPFMVYVISPAVPGGYASGILGCGAGVHLVTTLQSVTFNGSTGQYVALFSVANKGGSSATNINVTASLLNSTVTSTILPLPLETLGCDQTAQVKLTFPSVAGAAGRAAILRVNQSYSGGTAGAGFRVVLP